MSIKAYMEREKREDYRAGLVTSTLININRDPKKSKRVEPKDFFPSLQPPKREQSPDEMRRAMLAMAALTGGRVVKVPREQYEAMTSNA